MSTQTEDTIEARHLPLRAGALYQRTHPGGRTDTLLCLSTVEDAHGRIRAILAATDQPEVSLTQDSNLCHQYKMVADAPKYLETPVGTRVRSPAEDDALRVREATDRADAALKELEQAVRAAKANDAARRR